MLSTPGARSSEFAVAAATVLWYVVNAAADWYSSGHALELSAPAIAYVVSRGLAKYEHRGDVPPSQPPA